MAISRYFKEPTIQATPLDDVWSVIVPAARTNEITNPSLETNTTGYTAGAGSLARSTAQQYHGSYSAAYTPSAAVNDGFYYTFTSTVALRAVSCKFLGAKGVPYALAYASTAPAELVTYTFVATGRWQWVWLYANDSSATSRRIYFRKNGSASTSTYYVDGVQSETLTDASQTVSTYIDGDQLGLIPNQSPPAYYWTGTPHASTSVRSGLTRAGGEVKRFRDYGFTLMAIVGLGVATPQNVATEYARLDGGFDDYTRKPSRQFSLVGRFDGRSYAELRDQRGDLASLLDRDLVGIDQRLTLLHYVEDACGDVATSTSRITAKYQDGLSGNTSSQHAEQTQMTFVQYLPTVLADGESGATLSVTLTVANASYIIRRSASGVWSALGSGITGTRVYTILVARSGIVYVGGVFTSAGGVANTAHIAAYNPATNTWSAMGTGVSSGTSVYSLVEMPDGSIIAGGDYAAMSGVANTLRLASYNPTTNTWSALSTGANGSVLAMSVGSTGLLYLGGSFTSIGGVGATRLASWNGAAFSALGGGANSSVNGMVTGTDGKIYFTGGFSSPGNGAARWNPTSAAFETLGSGFAGTGAALSFAPNGLLYAAGDNTAGYLLQWNGVTWTQVNTGFSGTSTASMATLADGSIWVGGSFAVSSLPSLTDSVVKVTPAGSAGAALLSLIGVDLPGSPGVYAIAQSDGGDVYLGYDTSGSATTESTTTITNTGTARSYPVLTITGPSSGSATIYQLINYTTGKAVYFNLPIVAGETITMVFTPDNLSFTSDVQGNVASRILPGSNTAEMFLQPGANTISFLASSSTVTAAMRWRPAFATLDNVP